jgi:outer membrane protein assembly factor BamB
VAVVVVAGLLAVGCSSEGDGSSLNDAAPPVDTAPPTTVDPFAEQVVDACGNDLSELTSTVWAVDPADGTVQWTTEVPLAANYLLRSSDGDPQLSLELRSVEVVLDDGTGEIVDTPPAGAHEVLVDVAGATETGVGGLFVDGEKQPAEIEVDGRRLTTAAGQTGQTTVGLTAFDAGSVSPAWRVDLGSADQLGSLSAPVLFGDTVVVVTSVTRPTCA